MPVGLLDAPRFRGWVGWVMHSLLARGVGCRRCASDNSQYRLHLPKTTEQVLDTLRKHPRCVVVGEAWSFWIKSEAPPRPSDLLVLGPANWGRCRYHKDLEVVFVRTGTRWGDLSEFLGRRGRAVADRPQFDGLTVGGAVRTSAHGWNARHRMVDAIVGVAACDRRSGRVERWGVQPSGATERQPPCSFEGLLVDPDLVLLEISFGTVPSQILEVHRYDHAIKEVMRSDSAIDEVRWTVVGRRLLAAWGNAAFRAMFISSTRCALHTGNVATFRRRPKDDRRRLEIRKWKRWLGIPHTYHETMRMHESHTMLLSVSTMEWILAALSGTVNFELFMKCPAAMHAPVLGRLLATAPTVHAEWHGRTELRCHCPATAATCELCVDVVVARAGVAAYVREVVCAALAACPELRLVGEHRGKWSVLHLFTFQRALR